MKPINSQIWGIALNYEQKSTLSFITNDPNKRDLFGARRQAENSGESGARKKAEVGIRTEGGKGASQEASDKKGQEANAQIRKESTKKQ